MKQILTITAFVVALFTATFSHAYDWQKDGERLVYKVKFSFITVGEGEMAFYPSENAYEVVSRAWSDGGVSNMFNIVDRWRVSGSHGAQSNYQPSEYRINLRENDYIAHKVAIYDYTNNTSTYQNIQGKEQPVTVNMEEGARDMTSALFYLRSTLKAKDVEAGDVYTLPVNHLSKAYTLRLKVLEKTKLKTALGKKEVFKIQPILTRNDGKKKRNKDGMFIWVTADDNFVPVQLKTKLKFGSFTAKLKKAGDVKSPSSAPKNLPEKGEITMKKAKKVPHANIVND